MRVEEYISINNIKGFKKPLGGNTFEIAFKLKMGDIKESDLPPIKVYKNSNGAFEIRDGRHRVTAFMLLGKTKIKAKFFKK